LSPSYDINPSVDKGGLALNIDANNHALDFDLARSVGMYFQLADPRMESIIEEVKSSVSLWKTIAQEIGISRKEPQVIEGVHFYARYLVIRGQHFCQKKQ